MEINFLGAPAFFTDEVYHYEFSLMKITFLKFQYIKDQGNFPQLT